MDPAKSQRYYYHDDAIDEMKNSYPDVFGDRPSYEFVHAMVYEDENSKSILNVLDNYRLGKYLDEEDRYKLLNLCNTYSIVRVVAINEDSPSSLWEISNYHSKEYKSVFNLDEKNKDRSSFADQEGAKILMDFSKENRLTNNEYLRLSMKVSAAKEKGFSPDMYKLLDEVKKENVAEGNL